MSGDPVRGAHVGAGIHLLDVQQPGAFQFQDFDGNVIEDPGALPDGEQLYLEYCCPRTGRPCGSIVIGKKEKPDGSPSWLWDGNALLPTLSPSVNCVGGCGWHGFLRSGVWESC